MTVALVIIPALAVLLWIGIEMPREWRKKFFKAPLFVTSSAFALLIGGIGRGVLGPMTGFVAELILFPGLWIIRKFTMREPRQPRKRAAISKSLRRVGRASGGSNGRGKSTA